MFASREDVLREAERHERIAANYRANLARLDDPRYAQPLNTEGQPCDWTPARTSLSRSAMSASAMAVRLRRVAEAW